MWLLYFRGVFCWKRIGIAKGHALRRPGSIAHDVSIGGSLSVNSLVSVVKENLSVELRSRFGNDMYVWKIMRYVDLVFLS
jgi:hypothetical protein